jgi:hypothetical protein
VGRQGRSDAREGAPRWPGTVALLSIGVSYLVLSDHVTVVSRFWLPGLMTVSAFGPTDTPVLSRGVKILTVIQTVLSSVVVIVLVAWAVGTL